MQPATGLFGLSVAEVMAKVEEASPSAAVAMGALCRREAADFITRKGLLIDEIGRSRLERAIGAALQRASLMLEKMAQGEAVPHRSDASSRPRPEPTTRPIPFDKLVQGWAAERKPAAKTIYEYKRVVRDLTAFLGRDDAHLLMPQEFVRWKAHLVEAGLPDQSSSAHLSTPRGPLQYCEERLKVRRRGGRKRAIGTLRPIETPLAPNQRWSLDFVSDQLTDRRRFRILAVVDDCTRECLALVADSSLSGLRVARELDTIIRQRGRRPDIIVSDNGTEYTSNAIPCSSSVRETCWSSPSWNLSPARSLI